MFCFKGCSLLEKFIIPESSQLKTIDFGVFEQCNNLAVVESKSENFIVENEALFDKDRTNFYVLPPKSTIKYFSFPTTLKYIRAQALLGCHNLELIFIPENITTKINKQAFENCTNLKHINIPSSIQSVGIDAFLGCNRLECGLLIQNRTSNFLESLVTISKLPRRCISECIHKCTSNQNRYSYNFHLSCTLIFLTFN